MWQSKFQLPDDDGARFAPTRAQAFVPVEVRRANDQKDFGLFSLVRLPAGTIIARDGGKLLTSVQDVPTEYKGYQVVFDEGLYLTPHDLDQKDLCCFLNHSCAANVSRIGSLIFVAKREIQPGEELTIDYGPLTAGIAHWKLDCACGAPNCRKVITGFDWQKSELAKFFWTEWPSFIQKKLMDMGVV